MNDTETWDETVRRLGGKTSLEAQIVELRARTDHLNREDSRRIVTREKLLKAERLMRDAERAIAEAHRALTAPRERW